MADLVSRWTRMRKVAEPRHRVPGYPCTCAWSPCMEWGSIGRWGMTGIAMKRHWIASACFCLLAVTPLSAGADLPRSGIDVRSIDRSVKPQDDFYRFANGHWLDNVTIPLDSERVTPSSQLTDTIRLRLRAIVDGAPPDSPELRQDWR